MFGHFSVPGMLANAPNVKWLSFNRLRGGHLTAAVDGQFKDDTLIMAGLGGVSVSVRPIYEDPTPHPPFPWERTPMLSDVRLDKIPVADGPLDGRYDRQIVVGVKDEQSYPIAMLMFADNRPGRIFTPRAFGAEFFLQKSADVDGMQVHLIGAQFKAVGSMIYLDPVDAASDVLRPAVGWLAERGAFVCNMVSLEAIERHDILFVEPQDGGD